MTLFQIRLDFEIYNRVARSIEYQEKFEPLVISVANMKASKQVALTFGSSERENEILRFLGRYGPIVKTQYRDKIDPVRKGRYIRKDSNHEAERT